MTQQKEGLTGRHPDRKTAGQKDDLTGNNTWNEDYLTERQSDINMTKQKDDLTKDDLLKDKQTIDNMTVRKSDGKANWHKDKMIRQDDKTEREPQLA